jgi:hypothetical protein
MENIQGKIDNYGKVLSKINLDLFLEENYE